MKNYNFLLRKESTDYFRDSFYYSFSKKVTTPNLKF